MRNFAWILIILACFNLLAGKFLQAFSAALLGGLILIFKKKKGDIPQSEHNPLSKPNKKDTEKIEEPIRITNSTSNLMWEYFENKNEKPFENVDLDEKLNISDINESKIRNNKEKLAGTNSESHAENYNKQIENERDNVSTVENSHSKNKEKEKEEIRKVIEKQLDIDSSIIAVNDFEEIIETFKRLAEKQKCNIAEVKTIFLELQCGSLNDSNIDLFINELKIKAIEESHLYGIKQSNTMANFMIQWLEEERFNLTKASVPFFRNDISFDKIVNSTSNSNFRIYKDKKNNKIFIFGHKIGYISPMAYELIKLNSKEKIAIRTYADELLYSECKPKEIPDYDDTTGKSNWRPVLSLISNEDTTYKWINSLY